MVFNINNYELTTLVAEFEGIDYYEILKFILSRTKYYSNLIDGINTIIDIDTTTVDPAIFDRAIKEGLEIVALLELAEYLFPSSNFVCLNSAVYQTLLFVSSNIQLSVELLRYLHDRLKYLDNDNCESIDVFTRLIIAVDNSLYGITSIMKRYTDTQ